ncbi:Ammonium transporter [Geodia barretti]|uniref:Ammonium transporter n=1 Tax=Geodia barretti TaxID=519541 RepID=A0AA35TTE5_GEOBA|nr:Ammonium transporter [Geodia barretti]
MWEGLTLEQGNISWMLVSSALVLFMTPGLALFYAGLARSKNASTTIMHSLMSMGIIGVVWVLWGYTIAFGPSVGGLFGDFSFFGLSGVSSEVGPDGGIPPMLFMTFQGMFAIIAPAILTGAFAERMKFSAYVLFMILWVTLVYAPVAHWVWAEGGWIFNLGALDFAGGNVVHITSGVGALAAALIVGRRMGFGTEPMESHNVPMVVLGTGMLWFGWFGFNAGICPRRRQHRDQRLCRHEHGSGGRRYRLDDIHADKGRQALGHRRCVRRGRRTCSDNAGSRLRRPNASNHHRTRWRRPLCAVAARFLVKLKLDDALSVWGVHGIGGTWGGIATGLFVGIGFGSLDVPRIQQIGIQLISIVATWGWAFAVTAIILLALKYTIGLRVPEDSEAIGLDIAEHEEPAYRF